MRNRRKTAVIHEKKVIFLWIQTSHCVMDDWVYIRRVRARVAEVLEPRKLPPAFRYRFFLEYQLALASRQRNFKARYRLPEELFYLLHEIIKHKIMKNEHYVRLAMSSSGSGSISTESRLLIALAFLGGSKISDLEQIHGVAPSTAYKIVWEVITAINNSLDNIHCDNSDQGLLQRAHGFKNRSFDGRFQFTTGAIDGIFIEIICPSDTANQRIFYSGGKKTYGVNLQVVCDSHYQIIAASCRYAGSTNDSGAFNESNLYNICHEQPLPYHWVGDGAYGLTNHMITPYGGRIASMSAPHETFNFLQSQVRIVIEQTFGILRGRFAIFQKPLRCKTEHVFDVVICCLKLHNFCNEARDSVDPNWNIKVRGLLLSEQVRTAERKTELELAEERRQKRREPVHCQLRDIILNKIRNCGPIIQRNIAHRTYV